MVVVLAHADAELNGGQFNGDVDAVFGGHTHLPFAQVLKSTAGTDIAVVQADHYGLLLGKVGLTLSQTDGKWSVTARTASNTDLTKSDCADADGVAAIVAKAKTDAEAAGATVVATFGSDFRRGTNDGTDYGANRSTESTASDLIADSFQNWIATGIKPAADHYVGLMNPGGVRADYEAGELTEGEAYQVQPFGNEMAYATYTGAQFRQILAQQFQPTTSRPALMLGLSKNVQVCLDQSAVSELEGYYEQIQGATLDARDALIASLASAIDDARARVISCVMIDGAPLGDGDAIAVASNSFLLAGGDNFTKLGDSAMTNTGILDRTVTGEYLAGLGNATADLAKRQSGVSATIAESKASIELAGLLYTATSEQGTGAAAKTVAATVMLADGTVKEVATSSIDPEITAGLPDTGTASLTVEVPAGVATAACTDSQWAGKQCATVSLTITAVDGSTRTLPCTYEVPVPVEAEAPAPTEEPAAPAAQPAAPAAKAPQLAKTGADSVGLLAGALALAMAGALAVARKR